MPGRGVSDTPQLENKFALEQVTNILDQVSHIGYIYSLRKRLVTLTSGSEPGMIFVPLLLPKGITGIMTLVSQSVCSLNKASFQWGRNGFDGGNEARAAGRGAARPRKTRGKTLVANDYDYALAA